MESMKKGKKYLKWKWSTFLFSSQRDTLLALLIADEINTFPLLLETLILFITLQKHVNSKEKRGPSSLKKLLYNNTNPNTWKTKGLKVQLFFIQVNVSVHEVINYLKVY